MADFLPEARVIGEEPAVGLESAGIGEAGAVVADLGQDAGGELDAEPWEAQQDLGVRVLRECCFDRFGELVSGGAGGVQLEEEGEHLLAECVFDQRRLVGPLSAEDFAEAVGLGFDATLAAGSLERGLDLGAGQTCGRAGVGAVLRSSRASGRHRPLVQLAKAARAAG